MWDEEEEERVEKIGRHCIKVFIQQVYQYFHRCIVSVYTRYYVTKVRILTEDQKKSHNCYILGVSRKSVHANYVCAS